MRQKQKKYWKKSSVTPAHDPGGLPDRRVKNADYLILYWELSALTTNSFASLQYVLEVLHHDTMNILQFIVDVIQVPSDSRVFIRFLRLLYESICKMSNQLAFVFMTDNSIWLDIVF